MQFVARWLTNLVFLVSFQVKRYRQRNPEAQVVAAGGTKGRRLDNEQPISRGLGWVTSRRAALILSDRELVCGSWVIPLPSVVHGRLTLVGAVGAVLAITTADGQHYQFGLTRDPAWMEQTVLDLEVVSGRVRMSVSSAIIWALAIGAVVAILLT